MVLWWLSVDLPNISAIIDCLETWLVPIERSFQGLSVAIKTVRIDGDIAEWSLWQIVALCHDIHITGYPRCWKTLELVSQNYWWPQMSRYISQYVSTCDLCLRTKPWRHSPVGELQLLSIPDTRWDTLSVDFMVELLESSGHDSHSGRSSQTLSLPCLEALQPPEVYCLWPWTPVCSFVH